jgi:hypothetical protein
MFSVFILIQLLISPISFWVFVAGAGFSLFWSATLLAVCLAFKYPDSSLFPEFDFASKIIPANPDGGDERLSSLVLLLNNHGSRTVRKEMSGRRFYLREGNQRGSDTKQVVLDTRM